MNDEKIRTHLIQHLSRMAFRPKAILEEVRVHHGNAIADVIAIHESPHCYEIKGSTDNIYKALKQSSFYELTFKKMTLVTTLNHASSAIRIMPPHWGVLIAKSHGDRIKFDYVRRAKFSPRFDREIALYTLWKSELLDADEAKITRGAKNLNREQLTKLISASLSEGDILKFIGNKLSMRAINQENQ